VVLFLCPLFATSAHSQLKTDPQVALEDLLAEAPSVRVRWEAKSRAPAYLSGVTICLPGGVNASFKSVANRFLAENHKIFGMDPKTAQYRIQLDEEKCIRVSRPVYVPLKNQGSLLPSGRILPCEIFMEKEKHHE